MLKFFAGMLLGILITLLALPVMTLYGARKLGQQIGDQTAKVMMDEADKRSASYTDEGLVLASSETRTSNGHIYRQCLERSQADGLDQSGSVFACRDDLKRWKMSADFDREWKAMIRSQPAFRATINAYNVAKQSPETW